MTKSWQRVFLYLISGEESRLERGDYWNHVFLSSIAPPKKKSLEILKIFLIIVIAFCLPAAIALLYR